MGYRRHLVALAGLIVITVAVLNGCEKQEIWRTYLNNNYNYSIDCPSKWSLSVPFENQQLAIFKNPDENETISILVSDSKGLSLDQTVNYYTGITKQGSYDYQLISDEPVKQQGMEARQLEIIFQSQQDSQRLTVKELYMVYKGSLYLVRFATSGPDLKPLTEVYQRAFSSFKLTK
ncbi:MAG: hypothetical protein NT082_03465 [Chloroflexi bacterium]|nr:hypothetical protein [Chloroflexota bacterium]